MPENAVYVGRPGPFGNPFTVEAAREAGFCNPHYAAVVAYRAWLDGQPWACPSDDDFQARRTTLLTRLSELRGRHLVCWCPLDTPCHADVLIELANREQEQPT